MLMIFVEQQGSGIHVLPAGGRREARKRRSWNQRVDEAVDRGEREV